MFFYMFNWKYVMRYLSTNNIYQLVFHWLGIGICFASLHQRNTKTEGPFRPLWTKQDV